MSSGPLANMLPRPSQPKQKIEVVYGDGKGDRDISRTRN
jgi:hypothetical protein